MAAECQIFLVHVAGTRMIAQGTDSLSWGDQNTGVMSGVDMLEYVPLHWTAVEQLSNLGRWVQSWADGHKTSSHY